MAKKKSIIKKAVIGATILLGLVGVSYTTMPKVKQSVDEALDKIVEPITRKFDNKLEELQPVTNLQYSEKGRLLTFDENLKATGYIINVTHKGGSFSIKSEVGIVQLPGIQGLINGDILSFEVIAVGDGINTISSQSATLGYVIQNANQTKYKISKNYLETYFKKFKNYENVIIIQLNPKSFNLENEHFVIEGTGKSVFGKNINFILKVDVTDYKKSNSIDFSDINNYFNFFTYLGTGGGSKVEVNVEVADEYIDMTELLKGEGVFDEYLNQGYEIETLQYENSEIGVEEGVGYVTYTGLYRATHPTKETVTFRLKNKISTKNLKEYSSVSEFFEDALLEGAIVQTSKEIYDAILNQHFINMFEASNEQAQTPSMDK